MEAREFSGKTVEDAITNASVALGVTSDQIRYEVVFEGKNGILGIGSRDAVIKVTLASDEEVSAEIKEETKVEEKAVTTEENNNDSTNPEEIAVEFLTGVFKAMELEVNIKCSHDDDDDALAIDLSGPEMGVLIGKRGQTLDSLQYLTNLAINRHNDGDYTRVKIDTEDYRSRRKATLENLAKNVAYKVKKTRRPVSLEAMNPNERRIIHSALQNDKYVTTHSEGEEPYRHIVVTLKK